MSDGCKDMRAPPAMSTLHLPVTANAHFCPPGWKNVMDDSNVTGELIRTESVRRARQWRKLLIDLETDTVDRILVVG